MTAEQYIRIAQAQIRAESHPHMTGASLLSHTTGMRYKDHALAVAVAKYLEGEIGTVGMAIHLVRSVLGGKQPSA